MNSYILVLTLFLIQYNCGYSKHLTERDEKQTVQELEEFQTQLDKNMERSFPREPDDVPNRIVGGEDVEMGKYAFQVSIRMGSFHFCGGSLIHKDWVVTAGHCAFRLNYTHVRVATGVWKVYEPSLTYPVIGKIVHPHFDSLNLKNDITLVKFNISNPMKFANDSVDMAETIQIQKKKDIKNKKCKVTGFGRVHANGAVAKTMKVAEVPLTSDAECRREMKAPEALYIYNSSVCAGGGETDACQGDSGGPLFYCTNKREKKCFLTGITSWGIGCATIGVPGVYQELAYVKDWIEKTIKGVERGTIQIAP